MGKTVKSRKVYAKSAVTEDDHIKRYLPKPAIVRLARAAGVKRISLSVYDYIRNIIHNEIKDILKAAFADLKGKQTTIQSRNIVNAIQNERGIHLAYSDRLKTKVSRLHRE
jgi:histone H3/H4